MHSASMIVEKRRVGKRFLGCKVEQSRSRISLNQRSYIKDILRKSHMSDCKPVSTAALPHKKQSKLDCPSEGSENSLEFCEQKQNRSLVGNNVFVCC